MANEKGPGDVKEHKTGGWSAHYVLIICTLLYAINYMDRQVFTRGGSDNPSSR
jgi:hypothetical protein